jgi:hypothetical protein
MDRVWSFSGHSHKIGVDVLVQHRSIGQDATLRVDAFYAVLDGDLSDLLVFIVAA